MSTACASGAGRIDPATSLVSADRAMAQNAAAKGLTAAFVEVLAYDGVLMMPAPVNGLTHLKSQPFPPDFSVRWAPLQAGTSSNGLIGYTTGVYEAKMPSANVDESGNYVTIWHREGGVWRVMVDGTVASPPLASLESAGGMLQARSNIYTFKVDETLLLSYDDILNANHAERLRTYAAPDLKLMRVGHAPSKTVDEAVALAENTPATEWRRTRLHIPLTGDIAYSYGTRKVGEEERGWIRVYRMTNMARWQLIIEAGM